MKHCDFMVVAGEPSGDTLAAELVRALRGAALNHRRADNSFQQPLEADLEPRFFGAGGEALRAAGVDVRIDLTAHAVVGLTDVLKKLIEFRRLLRELTDLAVLRQPAALICVDFSGFNRRLAHAVRLRASQQPWIRNWRPFIVQFVSPQVWASREGRASKMAQDIDLLLTIFPFEKRWYAERVPQLRVEYVGHAMLDRHDAPVIDAAKPLGNPPMIALLPGSRRSEIARHWPVIASAFREIRKHVPAARGVAVMASRELAEMVSCIGLPEGVEVPLGKLAAVLAKADLAVASTGTVTMECALFGVPTVALYKISPVTYAVGKQLVKVPYLAMPNILAGRVVFPEFIQNAATSANIAAAALNLLRNDQARYNIRLALKSIIESFGPPGASGRAAEVIWASLRQHAGSPVIGIR